MMCMSTRWRKSQPNTNPWMCFLLTCPFLSTLHTKIREEARFWFFSALVEKWQLTSQWLLLSSPHCRPERDEKEQQRGGGGTSDFSHRYYSNCKTRFTCWWLGLSDGGKMIGLRRRKMGGSRFTASGCCCCFCFFFLFLLLLFSVSNIVHARWVGFVNRLSTWLS